MPERTLARAFFRILLIGAAFAAPMASSLRAQTAVLRTLLDRDAPEAAPAVLWTVEGKGGHPLSEGFAALLRVPSLRVYQVPAQGADLGSPAGRDLLARHGLPIGPHWLLVDAASDAVLAQGTEVPKADAFAQALEAAGFRDRAKELEAFLKRDPERLEARDALLAVLRARGEAAAQRFLGLQVESPRQRLERGDLAGAFGGPAPVDLSAAKPLTPVQDLEAWSAFTAELDADFRSGRWRRMELAWTREGRPLDAASPTLQGLYLRWMPAVESALREDPSSEALWSLWCWMSEATGGRRVGPLLASLRPSPLTPPSQWPPEGAARLLREAAKTPQDWAALKAHYEAVWSDGSHPLLERAVEKTDLPWASDWTNCLGPLIECCLRAGEPAQADGLVRGAWSASHWSALPAKASALASRCGNAALAARWAALGAR